MNIKQITVAVLLGTLTLASCSKDNEPLKEITTTSDKDSDKDKEQESDKDKDKEQDKEQNKDDDKGEGQDDNKDKDKDKEEEEKPKTKNKLTQVLDYRPAVGQFVNVLPQYEEGDDQEKMNAKVLLSLTSTDQNKKAPISLGGFGGYVVFGFERDVDNVKGYDIEIRGNAFPNNSEPGIVSVANDDNGNGKPDEDEWYELKGSEYDQATTIKGYEITYKAWQEADKNKPKSFGHSAWTDNQGNTGEITGNKYHQQAYYPKWLKNQDSYTLKGTRLKSNAVKKGAFYMLPALKWGYVDNVPSSEGSRFDLDNAVDKNGKAVQLKSVKWVKVHTAMNKVLGALGEISTEITAVDFPNPNAPTND